MQRSFRRRQDVVADLSAAGAAGLTLGSAQLYFPLGWLGELVTAWALGLGLASSALALALAAPLSNARKGVAGPPRRAPTPA